MTKPPKKKSMINGFEGPKQAPNPHQRSVSRGSTSSSTGLLSNVPYSNPTASNVFGIGSEHPFANYWTCQGGLPETISVLPEKIQADILLDRYFECVDPVYPMIHRQTFYADYEHFWSLPQPEKDRVDGTLVAMIFAMLAMGTQFVTTTGPKERQQTAEFYVSAAHQVSSSHPFSIMSFEQDSKQPRYRTNTLILPFLTSPPVTSNVFLPQQSLRPLHPSHGSNNLLPHQRQPRLRRLGLRRNPNPPSLRHGPPPRPQHRLSQRLHLRQANAAQTLASRPVTRPLPHRPPLPPPISNTHRRQRRRPHRRLQQHRTLQPHRHSLHPRVLDAREPRPRNDLLATLPRLAHLLNTPPESQTPF